jgi:hypothetical protein
MEDYLKNKIKEQYLTEGLDMYANNTKFVTESMNHPNNDIHETDLRVLEKGKFYFLFYDLNGKSSKMEKFNPLFVVDWFDLQGTRMIYAVSCNFLPIAIRTVFFNNICNHNKKTIEDNLKKDYTKQEAFTGINFANIYKLLYNIGFEWSIRQFDAKKVQKIFVVSTNVLEKFLTMNTQPMTGVDEGKLMDIWKKKITEQQERHTKILKEILEDYKEMDKELSKTYETLDTQNNNLQESLNILNKL